MQIKVKNIYGSLPVMMETLGESVGNNYSFEVFGTDSYWQ